MVRQGRAPPAHHQHHPNSSRAVSNQRHGTDRGHDPGLSRRRNQAFRKLVRISGADALPFIIYHLPSSVRRCGQSRLSGQRRVSAVLGVETTGNVDEIPRRLLTGHKGVTDGHTEQTGSDFHSEP
ncbi:hypothetical protein AOLI_G00027130 [Acnodon oligacanthus]